MKKIIALLLALVMVIGLVACGNNNNQPAGDNEKPAGNDEKPADNDENALAGTYDITIWSPKWTALLR